MISIIVAALLVAAAVDMAAYLRRYNAATRKRNERSEEEGWGRKEREVPVAWSLVPLALAAVALGVGCVYAQDVGEAVVIRNLGGSTAGHTTEAGFHLKAPWQDVTSWDIRNRLINLYRDNEYRYDNGSYDGATVTVNDQSGTKADVDVQVIYSIDPESVERLYADYGTQEAYVSNYVSNDQRALNAQETAKVEAETKAIEAQGEADANAILSQSLTPEVLQQRYYETLREIGEGGNLVLLPEGSTPIVSTSREQ